MILLFAALFFIVVATRLTLSAYEPETWLAISGVVLALLAAWRKRSDPPNQ